MPTSGLPPNIIDIFQFPICCCSYKTNLKLDLVIKLMTYAYSKFN